MSPATPATQQTTAATPSTAATPPAPVTPNMTIKRAAMISVESANPLIGWFDPPIRPTK